MWTNSSSFSATRCSVLLIALLLASCGGDDGGGGIAYSTLHFPGAAPNASTGPTGIRGVDSSSDVYISGASVAPGAGPVGLLYRGPLDGSGTWFTLNYPSSQRVTVTGTSVYGPDNNGPGSVVLVGNYATSEQGTGVPIGFVYLGSPDGSGEWRTITPPGAAVTIAHSTMGGFVVGNYETSRELVTGKAFIYDISGDVFYELVKPRAVSITAYGIWYNGGTSYTITGGYADPDGTAGYLVDWDSATQTTSNWATYRDPNAQASVTPVTHFEGITTDGSGGYNLASDTLSLDGTVFLGAAIANVPRTSSGAFGEASWQPISFPNATITSANTVYQNSIVGVYTLDGDPGNGYVATVPGF